MWEQPDTFSSFGARQLAQKIQTYWHNKGHLDVSVWIEPLRMMEDGLPSIYFQVRSNIAERIFGVPANSHAVLQPTMH